MLRLAVAAVVLLAVGSAYRAVTHSDQLIVPREVIALASWRPSTDVLLETPGRDLLRATPTLGTSILGATVLDIRSTGDER
jgi:hypothetical protein